MVGIASDTAKWDVGHYRPIIYHCCGKSVNITNDSRCLNTMLIFDGDDGSSLFLTVIFEADLPVGSIFILTKCFFKVGPPYTTLDQL